MIRYNESVLRILLTKKINARNIFLIILVFNLIFYLFCLQYGLTIFDFSENANTDGASYYKIALDPFSDPPVDSGFRYATFLYPLLTYFIAQGDPNLTAISMELINIIFFAASVAVFYKIVKVDGHGISTVFYAFSPIMLISTHGAMNEPMFFFLIFTSYLLFRENKFLKSSVSLGLACIARPDFAVFTFPFFIMERKGNWIKYLMIPIATISIHGLYLVSRFGLEHFLRFTSGIGSGIAHSMLGIPFYTFFQNRFFGGVDTPMITGYNLIVNEIITWSVFLAVTMSIILLIKKREDKFSLYLLIFSSIVQPAYSYFAGYFRLVSLAPSIYKMPTAILKNTSLIIFSIIYTICGIVLLVAWFI